MTVFLIFDIFLAIVMIYIYNKFVTNKNHVNDAWSTIDVFLKKRHDLIPLLVNTVKGYSNYEADTFEKVTDARMKAQSLDKKNINEKLKTELEIYDLMQEINLIQENYPELKTDLSYIQLQKDIAKIELDIEKSRRYYNACVRINNTYGEQFPAVIFTKILGFKKFDFFSKN